MDYPAFLKKVSEKHKLLGYMAEALIEYGVPGAPAKNSYSTNDLKRIDSLVSLFGHPVWASAASHLLRPTPLTKTAEGGERLSTYLASRKIFGELKKESEFAPNFFIRPTSKYSLDAPFSLSVFMKAEQGEQDRELVRIPFDLRQVNGFPHLVLASVQGAYEEKSALKALRDSLEENPKFKGKDWRTKIVLLMEETAHRSGAGFAALDPEHNPILKKMFVVEHFDIPGATEMAKATARQHNRAKSYLYQSYSEAGLKRLGRGSKYFTRRIPFRRR